MKIKSKGVTLLEVLLVLAISAMIVLAASRYLLRQTEQMRRDRAALQMQQILNVALAYYAANGTWPVTCGSIGVLDGTQSPLQVTPGTWLPTTIRNPFGGENYEIGCNATTGNFFVRSVFPANEATIMSGMLPLASVSGTTVTAFVNIPGQNLNNARSFNFGSVYHSGACVPVPSCPLGMTPQIVAVPAGVTASWDPPTKTDGGSCSTSSYDAGTPFTGDCNTVTATNIQSFYVETKPPVAATASSPYGPLGCLTADATATPAVTAGDRHCYGDTTNTWSAITDGQLYWRVCLHVYTEEGYVNNRINSAIADASPAYTPGTPGSTSPVAANSKTMFWTQSLGVIYALTRCVPANENAGSSINVWGN